VPGSSSPGGLANNNTQQKTKETHLKNKEFVPVRRGKNKSGTRRRVCVFIRTLQTLCVRSTVPCLLLLPPPS
jgi:hypothetical protein